MPRRINAGLKKRCLCPRQRWPKCGHGWHFGFNCHGREWRYSLDKIASLRGELEPRTKADALAWADRLRGEIRSGRDPVSAPAPTLPSTDLTFGDICDRYLLDQVHVPTRRPRATKEIGYQVAAWRRATVPAARGATIPLENKPHDGVMTADVEHVRSLRRATAKQARLVWDAYQEAVDRGERVRPPALPRPSAKGGEVGTNRLLARLRHIFGWAIKKGYSEHTPFKRHGQTVISLESRVERPRRRRLEPGEEERLLEHAQPHLEALIVAMLETGCRPGELLALTWEQVRLDDNVLCFSDEITKTAVARTIPLSNKLKGFLEMRRTDPKGVPFPPSAFVFGNEFGAPVKSVKRAWTRTCERAGIEGLHLHDLRREFASQLQESPGVSPHEVSTWLGHSSISTTSRYLSTTTAGHLHHTLKKREQARQIRTKLAQNAQEATRTDMEESTDILVPETLTGR